MHGLSNTPEYEVWLGIHVRCTNQKHKAFPRYGGAGITVDPRWRSFERFLADIGKRPSKRHSIERKDGHGPYSPENCIWATREQQANNKSNNRLLTIDGRTQTLRQWAIQTNISDDTIAARLARGWSAQRAISTPVIISRIPKRYRPHA